MKFRIQAHCVLLAVVGMLQFHSDVNADIVISVIESNGNVEFVANGSVNLSGLTLLSSSAEGSAVVRPNLPLVSFSTFLTGGFDVFTGVSGPSNFGTGAIVSATVSSGDNFGISQIAGSGIPMELFIPKGYSSNSPISSSMTFSNSSFGTLGMTTGTYVWSWGSGVDADTLTLNVGTTVPEPSGATFVLMAASTAFCRRRRKSKSFQKP